MTDTTDTGPTTGNPHADRTTLRAQLEKGRCNFCKQLIVWTTTDKGARMPVDWPAPVTGGNVLLVLDDRKGLIATVLGTLAHRRAYSAVGWPLYLHHRLSCPDAERWARDPANAAPLRVPARRGAPRRSRA
jgi:hypothetical protein